MAPYPSYLTSLSPLLLSGVSREDFVKLMQHSEIPGPERYAISLVDSIYNVVQTVYTYMYVH